jgi:cytochrome c-type biogenesis protein CcmH
VTGSLSGMRGGEVRRVPKTSHFFSRILVALFILFAAFPAFAVNPDEVLADPALEARARSLSAELRCMVCQNQSIDDSNADLAKDLRLLVRERISDGDTDEEVLNYIVSRYGEFVLLKPRLSLRTILLWGAPVLLVAAGGVALTVFARRRAGKPTGSRLTAEEQAKLDELLGK